MLLFSNKKKQYTNHLVDDENEVGWVCEVSSVRDGRNTEDDDDDDEVDDVCGNGSDDSAIEYCEKCCCCCCG